MAKKKIHYQGKKYSLSISDDQIVIRTRRAMESKHFTGSPQQVSSPSTKLAVDSEDLDSTLGENT